MFPTFDIIIGTLLVCLLIAISVIWCKKPPQNYYTRVATIELVIALFLSLFLAFMYHTKVKNTRLYDYRFEIPFYIVIKLQYAMIFGWITFNQVLKIIQ